MRLFLERHWLTIAGFSVIAGCVAIGVGRLGSVTVDGIVETSLAQRGSQFAEFLAKDGHAVEALLTGLSRHPETETSVRNLATLAGVESFAVYDRDGREAFRSKSDQHAWLIRDRAGGISSNRHLAEPIVRQDPPGQIVGDLGGGLASVLSPMWRDGRLVGFVMIEVDPAFETAGFALTLAESSAKLLALLLLATGLPLLFYVRRKNKIADASARIEFLANHDPLTRLLNRRRMQDQVDRLLGTARATREEFAYCCLDIDGLSEINDAFGQAQGDELLRVVASRLAAVVDDCDLLARIAADDFAVLMRRVRTREDMAAFAGRVRAAVAEPVELKGRIVRPQISIGFAQMPRDGRTQNDLVRHAQLALGHHKSKRSGDFVAFEPFMDEEAEHRRRIETLLRDAIENDGFELAYQPLMSCDGKRLFGFEALLRLRDADNAYVSPAVFVPVAESRGYIKTIGTWALREAVRQAAEWPDDITVSVNLSAVQFRDDDIVGIVGKALADAGITGNRIEIEIVESLLLERTDSVIRQLQELKTLGVSITMDDFGTGYSSLGYLWKFPFDKLKIDRSFVVAFAEGEERVEEIIGTIISLAHLMRMKVTTEGVETQEQADLLHRLGCDIAQGYHFGRPLTPDAASGAVLSRFADLHARPAVSSTIEAETHPAATRLSG